MFAEERKEQIILMLKKFGNVTVKNLSKKFCVTDDCIRKDLTALEKSGLLKKTYGGAISIRPNVHRFDVLKRKDINIEAKNKIAQKAVSLIREGDMVFLDISTSNIEIAKIMALSDKKITIVTNMTEIIQVFSRTSNIKLICVGGLLSPNYDGFIGSMSIDIIKKFRFDIAFLGTVGIDTENNSVHTYDITDGTTKDTIIKASKKTYLLVEEEKFSMDGNYCYTTLESFTGIISDEPIEAKTAKILKRYNVEII